ncbi:MAG: hypothetical protein KA170_01650 [Candidatus Promineofilum sp.]|nr:hypothetical protein [Promineifilum sp.]
MNLLLYTEARMKLAQRDDQPATARPAGVWDAMDVTLPDSLFEELGYFGALEADEAADDDLDDLFDVLFRDPSANLAPV